MFALDVVEQIVGMRFRIVELAANALEIGVLSPLIPRLDSFVVCSIQGFPDSFGADVKELWCAVGSNELRKFGFKVGVPGRKAFIFS